jgi:hypothetical protein
VVDKQRVDEQIDALSDITQRFGEEAGRNYARYRNIWKISVSILASLMVFGALFWVSPWLALASIIAAAVWYLVRKFRASAPAEPVQNRISVDLSQGKGFGIAKALGAVVLIVLVVFAIFITVGGSSKTAGEGWLGKAVGKISIFIAKLGNFFSTLNPIDAWNNFLTKQTAIAEGRYYEGEVEENQYTQLGVYLENLEASDPEYRDGDKVSVWANLKVKALSTGDDKPVRISVTCWMDKEKNSGDLGNNKKILTFDVYSQEEASIECTFPQATAGAHTIYIRAEYDFTTLAYIKAYFMDYQKKRSMLMEKLDIFQEFGITDTNPTAVFTNGPIKVGMATTEAQPIGIKIDNQDDLSRVGVTIENRDEGYVMNVSKLSLQVPLGIKIKTGDEACDHPIKEVDSSMCVQLCKSGSIANRPACENDCSFYTYYELNMDRTKKLKTFQNVYCHFGYDSKYLDNLLGNAPISTKYIRTIVDYDYSLEKSATIYVQPKEVIA